MFSCSCLPERFFLVAPQGVFLQIPITRTIYPPPIFYFLIPPNLVISWCTFFIDFVEGFYPLTPLWYLVFIDALTSHIYHTPKIKTHNGGCLGSHIDEERSKLRNVMRFAELVNHRIFERKWRSRVILRACLFECPLFKWYCFSSNLFCGVSLCIIYYAFWYMAAVGCVHCLTAWSSEK